jgi:hypothetical protein
MTCATCDRPTPALLNRTRCADCQREHREMTRALSLRRRGARRAAILVRVASASLPALRRLMAQRRAA